MLFYGPSRYDAIQGSYGLKTGPKVVISRMTLFRPQDDVLEKKVINKSFGLGYVEQMLFYGVSR